jgi:hypothetical protein
MAKVGGGVQLQCAKKFEESYAVATQTQQKWVKLVIPDVSKHEPFI